MSPLTVSEYMYAEYTYLFLINIHQRDESAK